MGHTTVTPAFVNGLQPVSKGRASRVPRRGIFDDIEIIVTIPNIGQRTRLEVTRETTVQSVKTQARTLLGLTQDFLKDEDFHMYYAPDESLEFDASKTLGDYPDQFKPWS